MDSQTQDNLQWPSERSLPNEVEKLKQQLSERDATIEKQAKRIEELEEIIRNQQKWTGSVKI